MASWWAAEPAVPRPLRRHPTSNEHAARVSAKWGERRGRGVAVEPLLGSSVEVVTVAFAVAAEGEGEAGPPPGARF